jgi:hypothetical protein
MELELETTSRALSRLESREQQLGEEAAVNLSTPASLIDSRNINDVSVDDVFLEELSGSNSPTPKKVLYVTPLKRGPSASSTPSRGGSIADEVKEVAGSSMPSPLCEKETFPPPAWSGGLLQLLTRWQESVRRAIIEQAEPAASGRLISALNRAMEATRRDLLARGGEEEEEVEEGGEVELLRGEVERLRAQLAVEREERARDAKRLHDVDMVEARLAEMAALLQVLTFSHHFFFIFLSMRKISNIVLSAFLSLGSKQSSPGCRTECE